jgi:Flp pilus assembly protein TadG
MGQATVEFALSLGLLLLVMVAALDFGRAFFGYVALVNAAREGARRGVSQLDPSKIEPAIRQEIQGNNLDPARLTVQYSWGGSGQPLVVTARYRFPLLTTSILSYSELNLTTSTTMMLP